MARLIIHPAGPLHGSLAVPGDKSISHRSLLLGALAEGQTRVTGWLPAEDCLATLRCVRALGVAVDQSADTELTVHGVGLNGLREPEDVLDCGGSGTTMRLLTGILAGQPFTSVLTGNNALRKRPMGRVADPLRAMGARISGRQGGRLPPLTVQGGGLAGIDYAMPMASAQVKSAILLAGLFAGRETVVREPGPARDHTERMLRAFGVEVKAEGAVVRIAGGQALRVPSSDPTEPGVRVPGDFSSAAFLLVAGCIVPASRIRLLAIGVNPTRTGLADLLREMGGRFEISPIGGTESAEDGVGEPTADLEVSGGELRAAQVGGDVVVRAIDEFPILAVAATQAIGATTIRDAGELRVKESDRISAVAQELGRLGARVEEHADGLTIHGPARLRGCVVDSHRDHRLAMALAIAGLVATGQTEVRDAEVVNDSYPGFVEALTALGADIAWA